MVVQDTELLDPSYPTVLVVPMTSDRELVMADLTVVLQPTATNGCRKVSYLVPQNLTCVAKTRVKEVTGSHITAAQLQQLRELIVLLIGALS